MWEMILWPFSNVWSALLMGAGAVLVSAIAGAVVGVFPAKRTTGDN